MISESIFLIQANKVRILLPLKKKVCARMCENSSND